jgi:maltose alpha-D-glucosyltransferase / alpha-amylase
MTDWQTDPLWYKDAVIYQLHIKAFFDSNNDGIGDFAGLAQKLDYVQDLGVNTIWLLPFYPSPMRDDGYDIADYHNIYPAYGTRSDFKFFVREAHKRGLKIITELVINHTSDQNPWFQAARSAPPGSAKRNYYVWSDSDKKYSGTRIIFTDTETSNWAWDPVAKAYYWHRFFSHQPDLNFGNPRVVTAVMKVMRFWLDAGVDGMRLDAIPYLCEREGTNNENLPETHAVLKHMRAELDKHYQDRMFLAEANQWPEDVREYFGDADECHMAYHFPLMPRMYMALALEDRYPIAEIMDQTPEIPESCQWAVFLRNHDELTLEMVTNRERDYMYKMYATDARMRVNVGIRRRLAPLMENDLDKVKLMNSMLLSMPGSPILYYGDEIGMGDNVYLGDRNGVRTPMQWTPDRNAGFSRCDPQRLYLPVIMDPIYGYEAVNIESQSRDPSSLLNWMKRILAVRKAHPAFGRGSLEFIRPGNRKILAYVRRTADEAILCVANLSRTAQPVELDLRAFKGYAPVELMGRSVFPPIGELPYLVTLPGYAFYWFALRQDAEIPAWHGEHLPAEELPVLVLAEGLTGCFAPGPEESRRATAQRTRLQLMNEVLPKFMSRQRWFAAKGETVARIETLETGKWNTELGEFQPLLLRVSFAGIDPQMYFVPLTIAWEDAGDDRLRALVPWTPAKVRQQARAGVLVDAFGDPDFCRALVQAMGENMELEFGSGMLRFSSTRAYSELVPGALQEVKYPGLEQSNTAVSLGDKLFLKGYRRLAVGLNPELEIGRFLTEVAPFTNIVPVAGAVEYVTREGESITLALLQGFVQNQGSGWSYTQDYLERLFTDLGPGEEAQLDVESPHAYYLTLIRTLGLRTGQLHSALSQATGDRAFDPEPITAKDVKAWTAQMESDVSRTFVQLARCIPSFDDSLRRKAERLLGLREALLEQVLGLGERGIDAAKTRYHGDYHLGQVLLARNDFVIIDFEGEPARPLAERRTKGSPLKDVAGMLRSFNYAASVALDRATQDRPADRATLEPRAQAWERESVKAFLDGYREGVGNAPCYPADPEHADALLHFFTLEKALYELRYELDNRPAWVGVPVGGLLELALG